MSPLKVGLFADLFPTTSQREHHHSDEFTSFDIRCAKDLLDRSRQPHDAFGLKVISGLDEGLGER